MLARPKLRLLVPALAVVLLALPATASALTVTKTADSKDGGCDADCSLREAIEFTPAGGTVTLPASAAPYEVGDMLGSLQIAKDLTIVGAGARSTEVTASGASERPFTVEGDDPGVVHVTIRDLSITGGDGDADGGVAAGVGGGVLATKGGASTGPELRLERVRVAGNKATVSSAVAFGGGIAALADGTHVIVRESTLAGNQAIGLGGAAARGGAVATMLGARVTIENTTIVGNEAVGSSPSLAAQAGGVVAGTGSQLINATVFGNIAASSGVGAMPAIAGNIQGGENPTDLLLRNTIVGGGKADVAASADCGANVASGGGNVLGAGCTLGAGDTFSTEPLLGPLADNGGQTDTMALLVGSPAIDRGTSCPPPATDQRGVARPLGVACDAGAYELENLIQLPRPGKDYFCHNRKATLVGTGGKDRLVGTRGADVIVAKGGADTILARGGNDLVCAGPGRDVVNGGKGKDRLLGQAGRDVLRGGPGRDQLVGGAGKDQQAQ